MLVNYDIKCLLSVRYASVSREGFNRDINQMQRLTYSVDNKPSSDAVNKSFSSKRGPSYLQANLDPFISDASSLSDKSNSAKHRTCCQEWNSCETQQ